MTFCIGIRVREGIVALADTQVVRGEELSSKAKLSVTVHDERPVLLMTSGLRSVRDKAARRWDDALAEREQPLARMHQVVTAYGDEVKLVRQEDGPMLAETGLTFNSHAIVGGCMSGDGGPELFMVYPEGNWIDATPDAPYFVIGRNSYGKPIIDRLLTFETPLPQALALAYLAFDATRTSVVDVDFPIDVVVMPSDGRMHRHRYDAAELARAAEFWRDRLRVALDEIPMDWARQVLGAGPA